MRGCNNTPRIEPTDARRGRQMHARLSHPEAASPAPVPRTHYVQERRLCQCESTRVVHVGVWCIVFPLAWTTKSEMNSHVRTHTVATFHNIHPHKTIPACVSYSQKIFCRSADSLAFRRANPISPLAMHMIARVVASIGTHVISTDRHDVGDRTRQYYYEEQLLDEAIVTVCAWLNSRRHAYNTCCNVHGLWVSSSS